jgi:uncharacterized membrane protein YcaP (DUF421 family)
MDIDHFMHWVFGINWQKTFTPTQPLLETVVRGTVLYLALVLLLRFALSREKGQLGTTDLLVLVLLGDASQNAMAGSYTSITDGLILVATLVFWSYALNWLSFHVRWIERILTPRQLTLVRDGRMLRRNMRKELMTEEELMTQIRLQGIADLARVREACMEADGRISVITRDEVSAARGAAEKDAP